jgi:hypothetical protein
MPSPHAAQAVIHSSLRFVPSKTLPDFGSIAESKSMSTLSSGRTRASLVFVCSASTTNVLALIFMSAGGSLPFAYRGVIEHRILPLGITHTVIGSALGAILLLNIHTRTLQLTIAVAMIAMAVFSLLRHDRELGQRLVTFAADTY